MKIYYKECSHSRDVATNKPLVVRRGDRVACRHCRELRTVDAVFGEWRIRCQRCRYSRGYGAAELTARTFATKHALKWQHPVAILVDGRARPVEIIEFQHELLGDEPPF